MTDRRSFVGWLGTLPAALRWPRAASATPPPPGTILRATPTVLYRQPDGRSNLVRVLVTGLDAPAARARVTDRRGTLVGTAGLLPEEAGTGLAGEVWVPLAEPAQYRSTWKSESGGSSDGACGSCPRAGGPCTGSLRATPISGSPTCGSAVSRRTAGTWTRHWPASRPIPISGGRRSAHSRRSPTETIAR